MMFTSAIFLYILIPLVLLLFKTRDTSKRIYLFISMLLVLALANPSLSKSVIDSKIHSRDLIIALDVSGSMNAEDIYPSRYVYAKEVISHILRLNPKDNVMLLAFSSNTLLLSPPTTDHKLIEIALESFNIKYVLTKGTSLKNLFAKLKEIDSENKNIILLTDGGEEDDLDKITYRSNLIVLGLASTQGITLKNDKGLMQDSNQNLIISRLNPALKSLSPHFIQASSSALSSAKEITAMFNQNKNIINKKRKSVTPLYQFPLLLAFILFMLINTSGKKYLWAFLLLFGIQANASFWDSFHLISAYSSYEKKDFNSTQEKLSKIDEVSLHSVLLLASSYYRQKSFKKAIKIYQSIKSTSPIQKSALYYNLGNCFVQQKKYSKAKASYLKSLQLNFDKNTLDNLHLIASLKDKKQEKGLSAPKSKSNSSSQSQNEKNSKENKNKSNSSGAGGGGSKEKSKDNQKKLKSTAPKSKHPMSSKVYELINQGYINEKKPW